MAEDANRPNRRLVLKGLTAFAVAGATPRDANATSEATPPKEHPAEPMGEGEAGIRDSFRAEGRMIVRERILARGLKLATDLEQILEHPLPDETKQSQAITKLIEDFLYDHAVMMSPRRWRRSPRLDLIAFKFAIDAVNKERQRKILLKHALALLMKKRDELEKQLLDSAPQQNKPE